MIAIVIKSSRNKKVRDKKKVKFNNYKNCLLNDEIILKSQQRFKSKARNVFTEEINKIVLSNNDDKKLQTFDKITEPDSGLIKLVVMTNIFFNNHQHEIKTKCFICVKQIKYSFFSTNGNQRFYS